MSIFKDK